MSTTGAHISRSQVVRIKSVDAKRQIVTGEVFAPNQLDTYGEFMLREDIETMAHRYMQLKLAETIDTQHDNKPTASYPVESFIARDDDPLFTPGAWVVSVKCDDISWGKVERGEINGFSFEAWVTPIEYEVQFYVMRDHVGVTAPVSDTTGVEHDHAYFVQMDDNGMVLGGMTSPGPDGHVHVINRASYTEAGSDGSTPHRYHL